MQLGGLNLNTGSFSLEGVKGIIGKLFWGILAFVIVGLFGWYLFNKYKKKVSYITPITLIQILENGTKKERTGIFGGKFVNRNGVWDFQCKIPKQRKPKELGFMPDFSKADADGRLHFITSGDGTLWQQFSSAFEIEQATIKDKYGTDKTINRIKNLMSPVPNEDKQATINSIKNWRELVDKQKLTAFTIAIGAFIIMVIAHLVSLYIQTKIKCFIPLLFFMPKRFKSYILKKNYLIN